MDRDFIDQLHIEISNFIKRQSECNFPRGSMRNGLIDGTKCQSSERKGNLVLPFVNLPYNKRANCYAEFITIFRCQMERIT